MTLSWRSCGGQARRPRWGSLCLPSPCSVQAARLVSPAPSLTPVRLCHDSNPVNKLSGGFLPWADTRSRVFLLSDLAIPMSSFLGCIFYSWRVMDRALLCTPGCAVHSWGWWHGHCFYPSPATSTRSCGLGNGLLFFFCFSFITLKRVLIFKSLEHAWEVT